MKVDITQLFKGLNFSNKKTLLPELDNYIFYENENFLIQDAVSVYQFSVPELSGLSFFALKKSALLKINKPNCKYILSGYTENTITITLIPSSKNGGEELIETISIEKKSLHLWDKNYKFFDFSNTTTLNALLLKKNLKGYSLSLGFKLTNDNLHLAIEFDDTREFYTMQSIFGDKFECVTQTTALTKDIINNINGKLFLNALSLLKTTTKDYLTNISIDSHGIKIFKDRITIIIYGLNEV